MEELARRARAAAAVLATATSDVKNACLRTLADRLERGATAIIEANEADMAAGLSGGLSEAKLRRLAIGQAGVQQMANGLRQIADLPDPVGEITREYTAPSGLRVQKVRAPLGVILMIYEARPNVTIDAFALCFKAGSACILKGGREAAQSNAALLELAHHSLRACGAPRDAVSLITTTDRD
jgi:glutamate-5-semialdehyde dehydrogenase